MDKRNRNMKTDFFSYLPSEIITEILSRVPAQSTLSCKCVCKAWRDLVSTRDFAKLHLSKSIPGLALTVKMDKIIEITNDLHVSTITKLNYTNTASTYECIEGSADGLLLLNISGEHDQLYLCNPITREYIDLCHPTKSPEYMIYGFGVSKISGGLYKVVGIEIRYESWENECKVYTVGTGLWRSVAPSTHLTYMDFMNHGEFVNGSLHWFARDSNDTLRISCFDLETELFNTFSPPPLQFENRDPNVILTALEDNLCFCDCTSNDYTITNTITIWLMKVDKSWTKEFVIQSEQYFDPIRVSKDEVILMGDKSNSLLYYSCKNKTTQRICNFGGQACIPPVSHTPSLLSLQSLGAENSIRWIGSFP
ncbi:hypothetical protein ACS0TY_036034 [Phlomoides rotata]